MENLNSPTLESNKIENNKNFYEIKHKVEISNISPISIFSSNETVKEESIQNFSATKNNSNDINIKFDNVNLNKSNMSYNQISSNTIFNNDKNYKTDNKKDREFYEIEQTFSQNKKFDVENHLNKIGYRFFHYKMLLIISIVFFVDGCEMSNVNMLLSSIQNDLHLNTFEKTSISSSIFLGFFIGSFFSGFITNTYGRLKPIKYGVFFIFIWSFSTSISKNIYQMILFRILTGLAIGTVVPACKTLVTECIPSTYRSFVLSMVWVFYPFGTIYICILALNSVNGTEFYWRQVFFVNSLSSFLLIILTQCLNESPRYLLKKGKSHEAIEILDVIGYSNNSEYKIILNQNEKNLIYLESSELNSNEDEFTENKDSVKNLNNTKKNIQEKKKVFENSINDQGNKIFFLNFFFLDYEMKVFDSEEKLKENNNIYDIKEIYFENCINKINMSTDSTKDNSIINKKKENDYKCDDEIINSTKKKLNSKIFEKNSFNINPNSASLLFSNKFFSTSFLCSFIWFSTSIVSFGLMYTLPKIYEKSSENNKQDSMRKMIKTMLFVSPSAFIRGYISEIKFLGRKKTMGLGFLGAFINSLICFFFSNYLHVFSGLLKFSIHISVGIISIYTSEVYPTEIRSLAIGFGISITRLGAFVSPYLCELFDNLTPKGSFIIFAVTSFISFIFSLNLAYETIGKPLDNFGIDNSDYRKKENSVQEKNNIKIHNREKLNNENMNDNDSFIL